MGETLVLLLSNPLSLFPLFSENGQVDFHSYYYECATWMGTIANFKGFRFLQYQKYTWEINSERYICETPRRHIVLY